MFFFVFDREKQRKLLWAALTIVGVLAIVLIVYISQLITEMTSETFFYFAIMIESKSFSQRRFAVING
jgi:type IV secretory pathway component VirB8